MSNQTPSDFYNLLSDCATDGGTAIWQKQVVLHDKVQIIKVWSDEPNGVELCKSKMRYS